MSDDRRLARRHPDDQWNSIRSRFCELYQVENRPLAEVRQILKDELKFEATERQYKRKVKSWGLRKNATSEDYSRVESLLGASNTTGVEDIASSTGIPMTSKKIERYIKSKSRSALEPEGSQALTPTSSATPTQQHTLPSESLEENLFTSVGNDVDSFMRLLESYMIELPARDVRSTILYPELEKHKVDSWMPMVTGHQEAWVCPPQSNNPSTTLGVSPINNSGSQNLGTRPDLAHEPEHLAREVQKDESDESKYDILAQVNAARARSRKTRASSVWVNDTALQSFGMGIHHVRYETTRTVVAVRKRKPHHANGSFSTPRHIAKQL